MIVILYQMSCQDIAQKAKSDLLTAFADHVKVELISAISATSWPLEASWDDLLVVLYKGKDFPEPGNSFIEEYLQQRPNNGTLLPVSVDTISPKPPDAASAIKAFQYDLATPDSNSRLVNRIGAMLDLRLQGRDSKIFISYRASDGFAIAKQIYEHFERLGHHPWLDQAKEMDGETKILPGSPVQQEIDEALRNASLVLLLDTPSARASPWIKHEVDSAISLMLPILPICVREAHDQRHGSRFPSLQGLQRCIPIQSPTAIGTLTLSDSELNEIAHSAEVYLCQILRRKCRIPFLVKDAFVSRGFDWNELDKRLMMFKSSKKTSPLKTTRVLSHCSIFEQIYVPALQRYRRFIDEATHHNHSLFIYDGDLLSNMEVEDFIESEDDPVDILHFSQLAPYIASDFTELGTP